MHRYILQVGKVAIALRVFRRKTFRWLADYFMQPTVNTEPHITLTLKFMRNRAFTMVPDSVFQSKRRKGRGFYCEGGILEGKYSPEKKHGVLKIHPVLRDTGASRVFEQILYQAYYSVLKERYCEMPLVHSSGVIRNGKGYLFLGPSGAGKSTVAALSADHCVINDEITIADISGPAPMLCSTPFNGLFRTRMAGCAPLAGIFLLRKAETHYIERTEGAGAVRLIASQLIPPIDLDSEMDSDVYIKQIDIAMKLCVTIPVYTMSFCRDNGFWAEIDRVCG